MALWQKGTTVYDDSSGQMMAVMEAPPGTYPEPQFSFAQQAQQPSVSPQTMGGGTTLPPTSVSSRQGPGYTQSLIDVLTGQVVPQALSFDEGAARGVAEQEWGPYFDELLSDYLGELTRQSEQTQEQLGGTFADRGLYFSGQRQEEQRLAQEEADRQRRKRERDLARQRESAITGQVETLREEQFQGYA